MTWRKALPNVSLSSVKLMAPNHWAIRSSLSTECQGYLATLSKGYILPIGATLLYLVPVVIAPAHFMGIHPLASVMGIYSHISEATAAMVEILMQGVLPDTSPFICAGSLLLIGAASAAASVMALKKQSY